MAKQDDLSRREHEYVAKVLGLTTEALDGYPYRMEDDPDGSAVTWRVIWKGDPPEGVSANNDASGYWSNIPALFR